MKTTNTTTILFAVPLVMAGLISANSCALASSADRELIQMPNGVAVGDVDSDSAVLWSRADRDAVMIVEIKDDHRDYERRTVTVKSDNDYTGQILIDGLKPNTEYQYSVSFVTKGKKTEESYESKDNTAKITGRFKTAPLEYKASPVSFAWGGDLAGQNVCRDTARGFPAFDVINQSQWDFFIGLGDMIYADGICGATGRFGNQQVAGNFTQSADLKNYWAHWSYNKADPAFQTLLQETPYIAVWDDHEVVNDFGPLHDTRSTPPYTPGEHLLPIGLKAFLDYNPIAVSAETPKRLYRTIRWGKHVELFVLDTRQYRDANFALDNAKAPKTMLGREQMTWLKEKLAASDATWKIIVSSVPLSIPTGFPPEGGRDGWANFDQTTGFEYELLDILRFMQQKGIKNNVWLTTDVHFSEGFRYTPFADAPDFKVYEFVSGPLNAGLFPSEDFDDSLHPTRLFFHGQSTVANYAEALEFLTFGSVEVSKEGAMTVKVVNANGAIVAEQFIEAK